MSFFNLIKVEVKVKVFKFDFKYSVENNHLEFMDENNKANNNNKSNRIV